MSVSQVLEVRDLTVGLGAQRIPIIEGVSLTVAAGSVVGVVGESGCGKSVTLRAILGLLPGGMSIVGGEIRVQDVNVLGLPNRERRKLLGGVLGFVPQEPLRALNPYYVVRDQIAEGPRAVLGMDRRNARERASELLERVGLGGSERIACSYPHQLSGGMRQRVTIAIALASGPKLLLCDEPTTALDATVGARLLDLLHGLARDLGVGVVLVTHDMAVVARVCDEVAVMYAGRVVEQGPTEAVLGAPGHPYTQALLRCLPRGASVEELVPIPGQPPDPTERPRGCPFHPRCPHAQPECRLQLPAFGHLSPHHSAACVLVHQSRGQLCDQEPQAVDG